MRQGAFAPSLLMALTMASAGAGGAAAAAITPDASLDIVSDHRRRGLSWSAGKPAAAVAAGASVGSVLRADAVVTTLRGAARHGGADAVFDLALGGRSGEGPVRVDAGATAHLFAGGRGSLDFHELNGAVSTLIGPADLALSVDYAPKQDAIGGDNLYLRARARVGVIGTPVTLTAHVGRTTGRGDGRIAARRLRPDGRYHDWALGADYVAGPLVFRLAYQDSDIGRVAGRRMGGGATVVAGVSAGF